MSNCELLCSRSIQDQAYDLLGQLIIERQTKILLAEIESEMAQGKTAEMDAFFAKLDKTNLAKIERYCRKANRKTFISRTLLEFAQITAIVFTVFALTVSIALATSHTIRVRVIQMLINIEEQYTEIELVEDEKASFDIPAEWNGNYYLTQVPTNLEIVNIQTMDQSSLVEYADSETKMIVLRFQEFDESSKINVDTEDSILSKVVINDQEGHMSIKGTTTQLFWTNGYKCFVLTSKNMSQEEVLIIAESIHFIK